MTTDILNLLSENRIEQMKREIDRLQAKLEEHRLICSIQSAPSNAPFFNYPVYGCGVTSPSTQMIRRDCYHYFCEHDMGASIDCCGIKDALGDCPCSDNCIDYISRNEVSKIVKDHLESVRKKREREAYE